VDGQLIVDNGGHRVWPRGATGAVTLTRGVHAIHVRFAQDGGEGAPFHFELLWGRAGQPLERIPAWALTPRRVSFWAFALSATLKQTLAAAEWIWVAAVVVWVLMWVWWIRRGKAVEREQVWRGSVMAGSMTLNVIGLVGLPGGSWAADELSPVLGAANRFAHGCRRPPFPHYYADRSLQPAAAARALGPPDLTLQTPQLPR
jgi:predicted permease